MLRVALLAGLVALSVAGCSTADDAGVAVPVQPARLYAQNCARCHGLDGRGDADIKKTMPVRDFTDPTWVAQATSDAIARTIMGGKNQMPAFGGSLSMPKIQALSGYVRRLHLAAPTTAGAPGTTPAPAAGAPTAGAAAAGPPAAGAPASAPAAP